MVCNTIIFSQTKTNIMETPSISSFLMLVMGIAFIIIWIADINNNPEVDMSRGFFRAREKASNNIFWFHITAEILTGLLLIAGGTVIFLDIKELYPLVCFSVGALFYTSLNSLSWAFAEKHRYNYAWPMLAGLAVSVFILITLIF